MWWTISKLYFHIHMACFEIGTGLSTAHQSISLEISDKYQTYHQHADDHALGGDDDDWVD